MTKKRRGDFFFSVHPSIWFFLSVHPPKSGSQLAYTLLPNLSSAQTPATAASATGSVATTLAIAPATISAATTTTGTGTAIAGHRGTGSIPSESSLPVATPAALATASASESFILTASSFTLRERENREGERKLRRKCGNFFPAEFKFSRGGPRGGEKKRVFFFNFRQPNHGFQISAVCLRKWMHRIYVFFFF